MISDAKELFIADQLVLAIEKIIQAENFFFQLILKIRNRWLKMHGERIKTLNQKMLSLCKSLSLLQGEVKLISII